MIVNKKSPVGQDFLALTTCNKTIQSLYGKA